MKRLTNYLVTISYRSSVDVAGTVYAVQEYDAEAAILKVLHDECENINEDIWMIEVRR